MERQGAEAVVRLCGFYELSCSSFLIFKLPGKEDSSGSLSRPQEDTMIPRPIITLVLLSAFPVVVAASCATTAPAPESSLHSESSSGAIRAAEEVGAAHTPSAALHLQLAKKQV